MLGELRDQKCVYIYREREKVGVEWKKELNPHLP